jgi:Heparinase II/III-like protein/Heparinase II/III N-terminus
LGFSWSRGLDVAAFRTEQRNQELLPYEPLAADSWGFDPEAVRRIFRDGWTCSPHPTLRLDPPIPWDRITAGHRNWTYQLHAWEPVGQVLALYSDEEDSDLLRPVLDLVLDWLVQHKTHSDESQFAWYDMAVGMRAYRLGYILDVAARLDAYSDAEVRELLTGALEHARVLASPETFNERSNHGVYQAAGQIALARRFTRLPGMQELRAQGEERLLGLVERHFTQEGIHKEHSPEYHYMLYMSLRGVRRASLLEDEWFLDMVARMEDALAWFVLPNEHLAMFGDSGHKKMRMRDRDDIRSEALRFVTSAGEDGRPPEAEWRAFPEAGYFIARGRWPHGADDFTRGTYLAQICGFHSRVHKHADDLSFVWYDRGTELLVDSGRYGYVGRTDPDSDLAREGFYYSHPYRVYVESTRAHSTVEIDGRSFARRARPYGSALLQWGQRGAVLFTESSVRQFGTIQHTRLLLFMPAAWLIVVDALHPFDKASHSYVQRFHLAPELDAESADGAVRAALPESEEDLVLIPFAGDHELVLTKGRREPELLGWISKEHEQVEPASTLSLHVGPARAVSLATLLTFSGDGVSVDRQRSRVNTTARAGRLAWIAGGSRHEVTFEREQGVNFEATYRREQV